MTFDTFTTREKSLFILQDFEGIEIVASLSAFKYPKYVSVIWLSLQNKMWYRKGKAGEINQS